MAENKMDVDEAREILTDMRLDEDVEGIYSCSERENTALWMAGRALEICKENGLVDYQDFVDRGRKMAENNFENLLGENGELVEFRRKQALIGAARLLQSNCENNECNFMEVDCPFQTKSIYGFWTCSIEGRPSCWGADGGAKR